MLTISRLRNLLFTKSFSWSKLFPIRVLRELKFFRRNSGKNPTTDANKENLPLEQTVSSASQQDADPSRLPFSAIQEAERNHRFGLDQETHFRRKSEKTPSKSQAKESDQFFQSRTQDKLPASKGKFGWVPIVEQAGLASPERREYSLHQGQFQAPPPPPLMANHGLNFGNGYSAATPRSIATGGRASSVHSGTSSTQSTPTKSVSKPMINGVSNSRAPQCGGTAKTMNFSVSSKKIPLSSAPPPVYASVEVPHFELKEDPSFWMDHNVQDPCLTSPKKVPYSCSTKHAEEVLYLEQELDRMKTIIAIEKSSRVEAEERAILSETELSITNDKLLLISKIYDATIEKLKDTRSVIEALESQQMLSNNELEELRENNNQLADIVKIQEQQISTMKKQLALRIDVGNRKSIIAHKILRGDYSESECSSPFKDKLKRVQASLAKAWNLNMRYQSDHASHSSEREMDEVRRQVEAETAEVIVCLQEELTTINQIVDECNKNELLAKQRVMDLEKEKKEQDDKLYLLTLENIRLAKLTKEKEQDASSIMEHWEQLAIEISDLLENEKTQLDNTTHEAASISDICSHKSWICEQFGKVIIGISDRDSLIEKLQKNLEDACYVRHDIESKLMTLRGAILAITEAQQQENSDKESRILHLTSLLAEKTSIISELEDKVEEAVRKVRNVEICAAIFFIIVKKLYEINKVHLQALDEANLQLRESKSVIPQKEDIMQGHASLLSTDGKGCQDQRAHVEQNYQQANSLEHWKHDYLDTSSKNKEENITTPDSSCGLVEAKMKLREIQMQMSTLKSCMHEYVDNQFKELEAMAFQLKTELVTSNTANPTSTKSEKGAAKSRGSGSPFKCMVGLAQQNNTEKDEEFSVARCKIDELEALAASRQNQIFMLNIRLAVAESMAHDVLRDLLGIKLDMTKYAKMNGGSHSDDSIKEKKGKELGELKRKVDEFVEERKSLLEEKNRRHRELIAAQIWLGKLEENEEFLSTENELLKADNTKLSGNLRRN